MIGTNDHWAIKCYYSQFCATSKEIRKGKFSGSHPYHHFLQTVDALNWHGIFAAVGAFVPTQENKKKWHSRHFLRWGGLCAHTREKKKKKWVIFALPHITRGLSTNQGRLIAVTPTTRPDKWSSRCGSGDIPHTPVSLTPAHHPLSKYQKGLQEHYFPIKWIVQSPLTNSRSQKFYKIGI